jgi:hypothetical protein
MKGSDPKFTTLKEPALRHLTLRVISNGASGLVTMRAHPGLNRGQSDVQSDALLKKKKN